MDPYRLPPQNLEAERSALGCMLLDPAATLDVVDVLVAGDFYRDSHRAIYEAILGLHDAGTPVDGLTLAEELGRRGILDGVGGEEAIWDLLNAPPSAANARYYAEIVRQKAIARAIVESSNETLREVASESYTADQLVDRAERRIFAIGHGRRRGHATRLRDAAGEVMGRIGDRRSGLAAGGLMSGFGDLDALTAGFVPGSMVVLAARPSMGKTALAMAVAMHCSMGLGVGAVFFSLEMGTAELAERALSSSSGVPAHKLKVPRFMSDQEWRDLDAVPPTFDGLPLWVDDSPSLTPSQIAATARRFKAKHDIGLVVVDYLQLVAAEDGKAPRQEQVAATSRRLKALAKEIRSPVLVLAQLNRQSERREDRRPMLSDLRESGQIEQDADVVMLLHRPEYYDPYDQPGMAELIVAKNRNGATAKVDLVFEKTLMRFSDVAHALDQAC